MNKTVLNYFISNTSISLCFLFLLMLIGAFFEVLGIGLFIPLLSEEEGSDFINMIKFIFAAFSFRYTNINLASFIISVFLIKFFVVNIQNFYIYKTSYDFMHEVKRMLMDGLYKMDFMKFDKIGIDTLNNIFTKEVEKSALSIRYLLQIGVNSIYSCTYLLFSLSINYKVVLLSLCVGGTVVIFQGKITKSIIRYSKTVVQGNSKTNLVVLQILENLKYIKSTSGYKYNSNLFDKVSKRYSSDLKKISFLNSIPKNTPEVVGIIIISLIIIINELTTKENIVTIVFLGLLLYRTLVKILSVQKSYQDFLINIGAIEKIVDVQDYMSKYPENTDSVNEESIKNIRNIDLLKVTFNVDNALILNEITLSFQKGNIYSLVGPTGAGKSSLLNILTLLYSPKCGTVKINNLESIDYASYRKKIGYVSQESVIFEATIEENILFGEALECDKYNKIINSLGINKIKVDKLSMGGGNISGGQKQLISLARELYKEPDLLILDEFTSALDSETEKKVMKYIDELKVDKIIVIVAHRLFSIKRSDDIYLLDKGLLVDNGDFESLYLKNVQFKAMCNNQNIFLEN